MNATNGYLKQLGKLPARIRIAKGLSGTFDFIHYFTKSQRDLRTAFPKLKRSLKMRGMLWISWPKQSSGVETDLTESVVQRVGLANGLVDVKVAAIDDVWSGLKFVWRVRDR